LNFGFGLARRFQFSVEDAADFGGIGGAQGGEIFQGEGYRFMSDGVGYRAGEIAGGSIHITGDEGSQEYEE
jgi:hypothetical protein